jgi:hypothetical protein
MKRLDALAKVMVKLATMPQEMWSESTPEEHKMKVPCSIIIEVSTYGT